MQQSKQSGNLKRWNLFGQNSFLSLLTKSSPPIQNQKAYSLKAFMPQKRINTIPKRPPTQAKVASMRVQVRSYCWMRSDFLRKILTNQLVLMIQKLLTTGLSFKVIPFSVMTSVIGSGRMLLSVLTSYQEKKMWLLTPTMSVNSKQEVSSSTQSRQFFSLGSMMGLAKQTLSLKVFWLKSAVLKVVVLTQVPPKASVHLLTTSFVYLYSYEEYFPLNSNVQFLGGHSQALKLSLVYVFLNYSLIPPHWSIEQGTRGTSTDETGWLFLKTLADMQMSKNL